MQPDQYHSDDHQNSNTGQNVRVNRIHLASSKFAGIVEGRSAFYYVRPSRHPAIPPSRHPAIPPSRHPAIPPSRHPAIPPSRHPAIASNPPPPSNHPPIAHSRYTRCAARSDRPTTTGPDWSATSIRLRGGSTRATGAVLSAADLTLAQIAVHLVSADAGVAGGVGAGVGAAAGGGCSVGTGGRICGRGVSTGGTAGADLGAAWQVELWRPAYPGQ